MPSRFLAGLPGCLSLQEAAPVREEGLYRGGPGSRARFVTAFGIADHGGGAFQEFSAGGVGLLRLIQRANRAPFPDGTTSWPHLAPTAKRDRSRNSTIDA